MSEEMKIWGYPPEDRSVEPPKVTMLKKEGSDDSFAYLLVRNRIMWFRRFCAAHNIRGSIQTEHRERKAEPDGGYSESFKATILMNGEVVATGHGSAKSIELSSGIKVLETAETAAIGRALSCAGFNLEVESPDAGDGDGMQSFADAPMPFTAYAPPAGWMQQPVQQQFNGYQPTVQPVPAQDYQNISQPAQNCVSSNVQGQQQSMPGKPMTLADAMGMICPIGKHKGHTLGEINAIDQWYIMYLAGRAENEFRSASRYPDVVSAAQMICDMCA